MMLKPIIFALVFAFLARGAGGERVNNNNDTKSSQKPTTMKDNVEGKIDVCKVCAEKYQECSGCSSNCPDSKNKRTTMKTDGTEGSPTEAQPTNTTMTKNFPKRSSPPGKTDGSEIKLKIDGPQCNCNHSHHHHHHNPWNLAPWIALTIVLVLLVGLVVYHWRTVIRRPRWNQDPNNDPVIANSDVASHSFAMRPASTNISQVELNEESKPLKSLLEHPNTLKRICVVLDTRMPGCGDYEAVAQHYGFDHYERKSDLEKADDGPSRALFEGLAARHPNLTVEEFVVVVEEKTKRGDVSWLLRKYDSM